MKIYIGTRSIHNDCCSVLVDDGLKHKPLKTRLDLRKHSPTGFEWGYAGSGPAQLALALLADALGDDERALKLYQTFKFAHISTMLRNQNWTMSEDHIRKIADDIEGIK